LLDVYQKYRKDIHEPPETAPHGQIKTYTMPQIKTLISEGFDDDSPKHTSSPYIVQNEKKRSILEKSKVMLESILKKTTETGTSHAQKMMQENVTLTKYNLELKQGT
jgi:hypothetical protein